MERNWTVYLHRHPNGAMFPVQSRIIANKKQNLDLILSEGSEELHCIQCKTSVISSKLTSDFVPTDKLARRYPHYEEGTVTRVIPKSNDMWYGWVRAGDGRDCYFAGSYGRKFMRRPGKLPIMATWTQQKHLRKLDMPSVGTRILFEAKIQDSEVKVNGWGFADEYDLLLSEMIEVNNSDDLLLPLTYQDKSTVAVKFLSATTYRIMEQTFYHDRDYFDKPLMVWEGTDLSEINKACPLSHLVGASNSSYNRFTWFERFDGEGWATCEDPRYASGMRHNHPPQ